MEGIKVYWTVVVVLVAAGLAALCIKSIGEIAKARSADNIGYLTEHKGGLAENIMQTCPLEVRQRHLRQHCSEDFGQDLADASTYVPGLTKNVSLVILDSKEKTFGCIASADKAWLSNLVNSKPKLQSEMSNKDYARRFSGGMLNSTFLEKLNLKFFQKFPVIDVLTKYKDWTKYMVVRHPMQHTLSTYYSIAHSYKDIQNSLDFLKRWAGIEFINTNTNFYLYTIACRPCEIDYSVIIKAETITEDVHRLPYSSALKDSEAKQIPEFSLTEHDVMYKDVQKEHPILMKHLVDVHQPDMDLFGYQWNWKSGSSMCNIQGDESICC